MNDINDFDSINNNTTDIDDNVDTIDDSIDDSSQYFNNKRK
jgi:hypothetical protein